MTKSFRCNTYKKWGRLHRLISRQRTSEGWHQPDRNQKAAVFLSHNFKFGKILRTSSTGNPHRVATGKFSDLRREVSCFKRDLCLRSSHSHR